MHGGNGCVHYQPLTEIPTPKKLQVSGGNGYVKEGEGASRRGCYQHVEQMHGGSLRWEQTCCAHLCGSHLGALWELCLSRWACHFLVGETSLLEQILLGSLALKS